MQYAAAQTVIHGRVATVEDKPVAVATVTNLSNGRSTKSDEKGEFSVYGNVGDSIRVSAVGFHSYMSLIASADSILVVLDHQAELLDEVMVYTGYSTIPKERSTGSFALVDNQLLTRSVSQNLIERLEGVVGALNFDRRGHSLADASPNLLIRGYSTIHGDAKPLIVLDNFPYEGDIDALNPNDVENITVLRDAAAASIWGARAANGVIVINTKKGKYGSQPNVTLNTNVSLIERPNLLYRPDFLPSWAFIDVERELFGRGWFVGSENNLSMPPLSPVVEMLIKERDGEVAESEAAAYMNGLAELDVRQAALRLLYRQGINQQYAININGGGEWQRFLFSFGYDRGQSKLIGDRNSRMTVNLNNEFSLGKRLRASTQVFYIDKSNTNNGIELSEIRHGGGVLYPYASLVEADGNPASINRYRDGYVNAAVGDGLLDWSYRPLLEIELNDHRIRNAEAMLNGGIQYRVLSDLDFTMRYHYQHISGTNRNLRDAESYYVRNLVNQFTQNDGRRIFPEGGVLSQAHIKRQAHAGRIQMDFNRRVWQHLDVSALAGTEVRQVNNSTNGTILYGYDDDVLTYASIIDFDTRFSTRPRGTARIPAISPNLQDVTDRFISYYSNASFIWSERYILSGSARWDASNLFGVKTNQRGVPLWSIGTSWVLSGEPWIGTEWIRYLKVRATYGYNGNVDKSATAFPTATYLMDNLTGLRKALIQSPGNPSLRWEKVGILNLGVDFRLWNDRLSGSIEYYRKDADDLLGNIPLDPTTGFLRPYHINYARTLTKGIDVEINSLNVIGEVNWRSTFLLSFVRDKVVTTSEDNLRATNMFDTAVNPKPMIGLPLYRIYSYPWIGLDAENGDPLVQVGGEQSKDYRAFIQQLELEELVYHGSAIPTAFGSTRNSVSWKSISISANISWKGGYYFRRSSINYDRLFNAGQGHLDFLNRWQSSGDENQTDVPSMPLTTDLNRELVYTMSELLIESGNHIRLQDISVDYVWNPRGRRPIQSVRLYAYAKNLGFIWRANKRGLDPDVPNAFYPQTKQFSMGLQVTF